jgi:hypothetical protein
MSEMIEMKSGRGEDDDVNASASRQFSDGAPDKKRSRAAAADGGDGAGPRAAFPDGAHSPESAPDVFLTLPDDLVCKICEELAPAAAEGPRQALGWLFALAGTCRRLREVVAGPYTRAHAWTDAELGEVGLRGRATPAGIVGSAIADACAARAGAMDSKEAVALVNNNRGVLTTAACYADHRVLAAVLAAPNLQSVQVRHGGGAWKGALAFPAAPGVVELTLHHVAIRTVAPLAKALPKLRRLTVASRRGPCIAAAVAAFPTIDHLVLRDCGGELGPGLAEALGRCARLRSIVVHRVPQGLGIREDVPRALCGARGLTKLDLKGTLIGVDGIGAISGLLELATLRIHVGCADVAESGCAVVGALVDMGNVAKARRFKRVSLVFDCQGDVSKVLATSRFSALSRLSVDVSTGAPGCTIRPTADLAESLTRLSCACRSIEAIQPLLVACADVVRLSLGALGPLPPSCQGFAAPSPAWKLRPDALRAVVGDQAAILYVAKYTGACGLELRPGHEITEQAAFDLGKAFALRLRAPKEVQVRGPGDQRITRTIAPAVGDMPHIVISGYCDATEVNAH